MPRRNGDNKPRIIVVRRGGGEGGGHHGGAWKIAYADFVTAMMAFFLVMWLINATTEQRRRGIANFFNPMATPGDAASQTLTGSEKSSSAKEGEAQSGTGAAGSASSVQQSKKQVPLSPTAKNAILPPNSMAIQSGGNPGQKGGLGSGMASIMGDQSSGTGDNTQTRGVFAGPKSAFPDRSIGKIVAVPPTLARIVPIGGQKNGTTASVGDGQDQARKEEEDFERDAKQLVAAIAHDPEGGQVASQVKVDVAPEGLRIQLSESDHVPMFETGSARLNAHAEHLLKLIAPYLTAMPQNLSVYGYTDGALYRKKGASNWTLSSERADSAREALSTAGFPEQRLAEVVGRGDRDLAIPDSPSDAANRRVVLVLHREHEVTLPDTQAVQPDGNTQNTSENNQTK
ncbi:flagellar motor protein MotB [Acetobacter conturbans]|uniref:OmpA family protein n=1 Tax=Acetobacter conturbans TaxID=1737472 RepID=A0ABX0JZB1_9PROT|nr:flagellar motor protein MotB [Acetobacter conturbans]NHN87793.1 OmpA family protein [Acetobacter conturbans]